MKKVKLEDFMSQILFFDLRKAWIYIESNVAIKPNSNLLRFINCDVAGYYLYISEITYV